MKVYSLILFNNRDGSILDKVFDVSSFGFFERSSIQEFFIFVSRTMNGRVSYNKRHSITHEGYKVNCYKTVELGIVILTDLEYPERALYSFMHELSKNYNSNKTEIDQTLLKRIQDPKNYDKISEVQNQLENTVKVMHNSIDKILERGEKLDDLVEKSNDLSFQSKAFYKEARKQNACCLIM